MKPKLETLTKQNGSKKQIEKIQKKIDRIHTILHTIEHPDVHLSIHNLKMYFGGIKAVNDLSFDVKKGEIFGLIGPNGAGKTTVFNCITQFYKATGGDAILEIKKKTSWIFMNVKHMISSMKESLDLSKMLSLSGN